MASQRTLPYFPTLVKRYDTRFRGIYARAAALVLSAESLRRWPNPATTKLLLLPLSKTPERNRDRHCTMSALSRQRR